MSMAGDYGGDMSLAQEVPTAVHIGADDLPWAEIGDGNKLKVIQVKEREGLWIVENIFQAGFEVQKHKHTGPVWGYTVSGAWKYHVSPIASSTPVMHPPGWPPLALKIGSVGPVSPAIRHPSADWVNSFLTSVAPVVDCAPAN